MLGHISAIVPVRDPMREGISRYRIILSSVIARKGEEHPEMELRSLWDVERAVLPFP